MNTKNNDILKNLDILSFDDLEKNTEINIETNTSDTFFEAKIEEESNTIKEVLLEENETIENEAFISDEIKEDFKIEKKQSKNKVFSWFIGFSRYLWTSALIFAVLLLTANHSAYTNLAKSYFFADEFHEKSQSLLNSVSASEVITKEKNKKEKRIEEDRNNQKSKKSKYSIKKLVNEINKEKPSLNIDIAPYENRVVIPKIGKNVPIINIKQKLVWGSNELENIFMKELEDWVVRYPWSSEPWEKWNTFIFGHSSNYPWIKWDYNDVFALLGKVNIWDEIISYYWQKKYKYKIREKKVITPWDVKVLKRNKDKSELTLMTCWPIGTTINRLIVIWELVEE